MNLFSYIKQRLPILDVVSEYATLKKAGLYWKGCCPFHHERTPSFSVSPHKEIFYCFGCHLGGDVISFIAKAEHCTPIEAAQHLIERYRIQVPQEITWEKSSQTQESKDLYFKTCSTFAQWCETQLAKSTAALRYITERKITEQSIKDFSIGYCPGQIKSLLAYAQKQGIMATNLIDAHILQEGKQALYSPFEERIIFPIRDHIGRFVGFGGRVFQPGDERAKYYNSHDHTFFNKGTMLFGLDRAKKAIAESETAFLVEGYTDLIIMNQYGFTNTVATLGTACTQDHLKQLARYAQKLYILYDGDAAGQNAIIRLAELCWTAALDPYVISLSSKDDPATFLLAGGDLTSKVNEARDIFSFILVHMGSDFAHKSLQERLTITKKIISIILALPDPLKRDLLLAQASTAFALPVETLKQEFKAIRKKAVEAGQKREQPRETEVPEDEISQLEKKLFSAILNHKGDIAEEDRELLRLWLPEKLTYLFESVIQARTAQGLNVSRLFELVTDDQKEFLSGIMMESLHEQPASFEDLLLQFYKKQWKIAVHSVKLKVYDAQQSGDSERIKKVLTQINELKTKMLRRGIHD